MDVIVYLYFMQTTKMNVLKIIESSSVIVIIILFMIMLMVLCYAVFLVCEWYCHEQLAIPDNQEKFKQFVQEFKFDITPTDKESKLLHLLK